MVKLYLGVSLNSCPIFVLHGLTGNNIRLAKRCMIDGLGVMLAGSSEPCAQVCQKYALSVGGRAQSSTIGDGSQKVPIHLATLVNGTAGHALDWEDTALSNEKEKEILDRL